jgi:hypothetical protein
MDYFKVFGLPILAGRSFERRDAGPSVAPKPIVVSRQFALRFFGNANVLGEIVESGDASPERMTIIGICGDRVTGLAGHSSALYDGSMIYELADPSARSGFLLVKAKGHAAAMADPLRAVLRNLTGSAASVQTFESSLADKVAGVRRVETLLFVLGIGSLLLAVIGVVGIVSADASQRRKELAIRLALGAGPWDVRRRVVLWGFPPVPVGVLFGLLAAWGLLRFGESARILPLGSWAGDPSAYVAISLLLLATAVGTLFAVAYPAGRQNPIAMLREE